MPNLSSAATSFCANPGVPLTAGEIIDNQLLRRSVLDKMRVDINAIPAGQMQLEVTLWSEDAGITVTAESVT